MNTVERIFNLIKTKKINQTTLAKTIEVSTGNITDWKSGKAKPSYGAIVKIARYFNVSEDYLLCKTDDPTPPWKKETDTTPTLEDMILHSDLSDRSKKDLLNQLELLKIRDNLQKLNEEALEELRPKLT